MMAWHRSNRTGCFTKNSPVTVWLQHFVKCSKGCAWAGHMLSNEPACPGLLAKSRSTSCTTACTPASSSLPACAKRTNLFINNSYSALVIRHFKIAKHCAVGVGVDGEIFFLETAATRLRRWSGQSRKGSAVDDRTIAGASCRPGASAAARHV